jgi:hypothetical protein
MSERPRKRRLVGVGLALLAVCAFAARSFAEIADAAAALAEADAHYARRAEGARGPLAERLPIDGAVSAYRRALAADPRSLEATYKLLRALFFRASFCGAERDEQKRLFEEGRQLGQQAVDGMERRFRGAAAAERMAALGSLPHAAETYFWTAVCWGQWAVLRGKLAAARAGAAGHIRDLAETVLALDPELEQGGGDRLLGRLHHQAPKIPFLTGWISKDKALAHLRRALERGPSNSVNQVFLAEALLDIEPSRRAEAVNLLAQCANAPPRAQYLVEDAHYAAEARRLLGERFASGSGAGAMR